LAATESPAADCPAKYRQGPTIQRYEGFKYLEGPNSCPVYYDLKRLGGFYCEPVVELANQTTSNNFFACAVIDPFVGDKTPYALEVMAEVGCGLKEASQFSQAEAAANDHRADYLAESGLLGWK
jgi:hypothetical protein